MNQGLPWAQLLAIALGSALGGVLRWTVQLWLNARWAGFPLGTLMVNCVGGLLIGIALAWFARTPNELMRLLLVTGFLGGLTTFSAFTGESLTLLQRGDVGWAMVHTLAHVVGALACCALGFRLLKTLLV
ncbi:MAG: fluoride efflux transporter CrcB [Rhizobacter sp.]